MHKNDTVSSDDNLIDVIREGTDKNEFINGKGLTLTQTQT